MSDPDQTTLAPVLPRAVLWDLDGTLIDTMPVHFRAWQQTVQREGFQLTWEIFTLTFGLRNDTILRNWLGADLSPDEIARISNDKENLYRTLLQTIRLDPLPGAEYWLRTLKAAGWRQALATMSWKVNLQAIFSAMSVDIRGFFDAIITAGDVHQGKPDPEIFLLAAQRVAVPTQRCIVVEDSPIGLEAAWRAGMRSIGVSPVALLNADHYVPSLEHLTIEVLNRLV